MEFKLAPIFKNITKFKGNNDFTILGKIQETIINLDEINNMNIIIIYVKIMYVKKIKYNI